jgi:hypothetical protein
MERRERYLLVAAGIPWLVCLVCAAVLFVVWRARKAAPLPWEFSQLGMACLMYAHDHAGSMPPDINSLPASGLLNPKVARDLTARVAYYFLPGDERSIPSDAVVAVEKPNQSGYRSVLRMDGSVVAVKESQFSSVESSGKHRMRVTFSGNEARVISEHGDSDK